MADITQCVPGNRAKILKSGVARVKGKTGIIVEVTRSKRKPTDPIVDWVTVDIPGHGEITVAPADLELQA